MSLCVELDLARVTCLESIEAILRAVDSRGEHDLLGGLVLPVDAEPTVDSATYWPGVRRQPRQRRPGADPDVSAPPTPAPRWRSTNSATSPQHCCAASSPSVSSLLVEEAMPQAGLALTRATVEGLLGEQLPESWSDLDLALVGTGRAPLPDGSPRSRIDCPSWADAGPTGVPATVDIRTA